MGTRRQFSREFKVEAVKLVTERGVAVAQAARGLDVHETRLRAWMRELKVDPQQAFPGKGVNEARAGRNRAATQGSCQAQNGARHPEKSRGLLRQRVDVKFGFVAKHRGAWPVNLMCEALGVSRSGFYAWLVRPRSQRSLSDERVGAQVRQSFAGSDRTYGVRGVWHDVLALGEHCGLHRIERLMREQALRARPRRRGLPKDLGERSAIADNVLDRQFQADAPNRKWVADFTYIWTAGGWLYVAAVLDLYSRRIVGWSMQSSMTSRLVPAALLTWQPLAFMEATLVRELGDALQADPQFPVLVDQVLQRMEDDPELQAASLEAADHLLEEAARWSDAGPDASPR